MTHAARILRATFAISFCLVTATPCFAVTTNDAPVPGSAYASAMRAINPRLAEHQSIAYATALLSNARRMHVDPTLVMAVVTVESHWNANAMSYHGAEGLGQLKPETARELGVNPWSGSSNIFGITAYLHKLLAYFADARQPIREAIAGYNAGPYAIHNDVIPQNGQTPEYVRRVLSTWHAFRSRLGATPSAYEVAETLDTPRAVAHQQVEYWGAH
jgi:soluble lytic murein transglycosylase-like protein